MNVGFFLIFFLENMFIISVFIIQSIFWDMSSYIFDGTNRSTNQKKKITFVWTFKIKAMNYDWKLSHLGKNTFKKKTSWEYKELWKYAR